MDKKFIKFQLILIKKTGNKVFDIPDGHICCGSAGTYNLLQNDIAKKLLKNKISNIKKINPEVYFNRKYWMYYSNSKWNKNSNFTYS